jgi:hypothetical protein
MAEPSKVLVLAAQHPQKCETLAPMATLSPKAHPRPQLWVRRIGLGLVQVVVFGLRVRLMFESGGVAWSGAYPMLRNNVSGPEVVLPGRIRPDINQESLYICPPAGLRSTGGPILRLPP